MFPFVSWNLGEGQKCGSKANRICAKRESARARPSTENKRRLWTVLGTQPETALWAPEQCSTALRSSQFCNLNKAGSKTTQIKPKYARNISRYVVPEMFLCAQIAPILWFSDSACSKTPWTQNLGETPSGNPKTGKRDKLTYIQTDGARLLYR